MSHSGKGLPRAALAALFLTVGAVVSVAGAPAGAGGGGTTTTTTSTTTHTTFTRVDLPDEHIFETQLSAVLGGTVVFDTTVGDAPGSPAVQNAEAEARAALRAAGASSITGPTQTCSSGTSETVLVGEELDHVETSVTSTTTFGPATILIGENQSETFFVAAGTLNVNTNTHTEQFVNQTFQTTITQRVCEEFSGDPATASPARPVPARITFTG